MRSAIIREMTFLVGILADLVDDPLLIFGIRILDNVDNQAPLQSKIVGFHDSASRSVVQKSCGTKKFAALPSLRVLGGN